MILGKYDVAAGPLGVMNLAILLCKVRGGDLVCSRFVGRTSTLQTGVVEESRTRTLCLSGHQVRTTWLTG
jgi:hypothetical protein